MKRTIRLYFSCFTCCFAAVICFSACFAQQAWQWGKAGANLSTYSASRTDMATDPQGNIYTINIDSNIDVDGYFKRGYSAHNICIVSFDCSGNFRWSKMISNANSFESLEIKADDLGGIYISGAVNAQARYVNIDDDAIVRVTKRSVLFVKYDTAGVYQWHFMPEPDWLFNDGYGFVSRSMCVSPNGDMSILSFVKTGIYCDGHYPVTDTGYSLHILSYNSNGNFVKGVPVAVKGNAADLIGHAMIRDHTGDKFYIYNTNLEWEGNLFYGTNELVEKSAVVGKFGNDGRNEWIKYSETGAKINKMIIDNEGSFYIGFVAMPGAVFDDYIFTNPVSSNAVPALLKYDHNGNRIWAANSEGRGGAVSFVFAASGDKVACAGETMFGADISWAKGFEAGKSYREPSSVYSDELYFGNYFVTINAATGALIGVDSLLGNFIRPTQMTGNKKGGFFTSGIFGLAGKRLGLPGADTITGYKGPTPFLVKYGTAECDKPLSIVTQDIAPAIAVYPNPGSAFITVENAQKGRLRIFNSTGRVMMVFELNTDKQYLSISLLPSGVYLIEITDRGGKQTRMKFVKF